MDDAVLAIWVFDNRSDPPYPLLCSMGRSEQLYGGSIHAFACVG